MNKRQEGFMKIVGGTLIIFAISFISLSLNQLTEKVSAVVTLIVVSSLFLVIWGLMDFGKAIDSARIDERQKNTGKVATADDIRKAFHADWFEFVVNKIELITDTDEKKHTKANLAEIVIQNAYSKNGHPILIEIDEKNKIIRSPQNLEVDKIYVVNSDGAIKLIERLV